MSDITESKKSNYEITAYVLVAVGFFIYMVSGILYIGKTTELNSTWLIDTNVFSSAGDFMGGVVGPILSLASILLFYETLKVQKNELKLQRDELEKSREVAKEQAQTLNQQRFENTFFGLLVQYNSIVNNMDERESNFKTNVIAKGRDCFKMYYDEFKRRVSQSTLPINQVLSMYEETFKKRQTDIGHYYRNLYHLVKYIATSDLDDDKKKQYMSIVRAQLSTFELTLLFYNCLSRYGRQKFKPYVEHYHLLKNLDETELIDVEHKIEYDDTAFG